METKLFASELKVMSVLWRDGDVPAKHIAKLLTEELGWNVNTTYIGIAGPSASWSESSLLRDGNRLQSDIETH